MYTRTRTSSTSLRVYSESTLRARMQILFEESTERVLSKAQEHRLFPIVIHFQRKLFSSILLSNHLYNNRRVTHKCQPFPVL